MLWFPILMFFIAVSFLKVAVRLPVKFADESTPDTVTVDYGVVTAGKFTSPTSLSEGLKIAKGATEFATAFAHEVSQHKCFAREEAGLASMVAF